MIFVARGNDDKLGRVWGLVFDRFFNRRYGKVGVCGKCFKRWYSITLQPRVFDENVFQKIVGWVWPLRKGIVVIC